MLFDPRLVEQAIRSGLGTIGESGAVEGTQFGRGVRRRELGLDPIPRRYYPGQADLLQNLGKVKAASDPKMLSQALQGVFNVPFEETFGFVRTPLGASVEPFFNIEVVPDMPFEMSSVYPILRDPKETDEMYKRFASYAQSKKYPAAAGEIQKGYLDLRRFNKDMSVLVKLGLARGENFFAPTFRTAFMTGILLEAAATPAASATLGYTVQDPRLQTSGIPSEPSPYRGARGEGVRARDTQLMKRYAELGMLKAKNRAAGGPLTAEAIRMYQTILAPSVGLRMGRGVNDIPLRPMAPSENPMIAKAAAVATKDLRAQASHELRSLVTPEVSALSPQQKYDRTVAIIKSRIGQTGLDEIMKDAAGGEGRSLKEATKALSKLDPEARTKAIIRSVGVLKGQDAAVQVLEEAAESMAARARVGAAPSQTRLTTEALSSGIMSKEQVIREGNKIANRLKPITGGIKNPALVLSLAAILSAGMMSAMEEAA